MKKITLRDILFAGINGAFIGILAPIIIQNVGSSLPVSYIVFILILTSLSIIGVIAAYWIASWITKLRFTFQLAKFGLIGITNTIIDLGVFNLFIYLTDIAEGNMILAFKVVSVNAAIINSYIWNKYWSFQDKKPLSKTVQKKEVIQFWVISIIGLILNAGITWFMINLIGAQFSIDTKAWASVASATASIIVLSWNFLGYKYIVFKK